jgi:NAD-dependent deacetylase
MLEKNEKPMCKCGFVAIRPDVVLFDEWLNDEVFDAAYWEAKKCDLMIAMGSSLVVRPACSLLSEINDDCKLVIVNQDETPYDKKADYVTKQNCGELMDEVMALL